MSLPIFFPPPVYVPSLPQEGGVSLRDLCTLAGVECRASGRWCDRIVHFVESKTSMTIRAEPGYRGTIEISVPVGMGERDRARLLLGAMAYGLFDGVARESLRGVAWSKNISVRGRPRLPHPLSNAQRQRRWRASQKNSESL